MAVGFSPLDIFSVLSGPFQWVLKELVMVFSQVPPLAYVGAFGLAVIVLTIGIRGVLFPVFGWQLRTSRRIQAEQRLIAPQLQELRKKYKKEPQKLSAEMNKLYKEHGISPLSSLTGCIPALVQMPVLIGLYQSIRAATSGLNAGDRGFLWIGNVAQSAHDSCCSDGNLALALAHPTALILPLLAGAFTFAQSRMMMPQTRPDMSDQERSMQSVSKQMSMIFPVMIFVFSFFFPQGLAIYWVTGTMFMVAQQYHLLGWGALHVPSWVPGAGRVTPLSLPRHPVTKTKVKGADVSANGSKNTGANGSGPAKRGGSRNPGATRDGDQAGEPVASTRSAATRTASRSTARSNRPNRRRRRR